MILTPGGNVITKQLVINVPLNLGGKVYGGSEKATRGGKCEPIKITWENLTYVPNLTQRACTNTIKIT
jgi:hypothetical protein